MVLFVSDNAQGRVASVTDASAKVTSYAYDAFGDLVSATDPASNVIANSYDVRGRKTVSSDPDMGGWSYVYDGFGELYSQNDAKSQVTTLGYDALGRAISRVEPDMTSGWVYDSATYGIGKIAAVTCSGTACASGGYTRSYIYDGLGRPSELLIYLGSVSRYTTTTYNTTNGQIATVRAFSGFTTTRLYTTLGYLSQIVDASSNFVYWTANARDAELHAISQTLGNGVQVTQDYDPNSGRIESVTAGAAASVANMSYSWDSAADLVERTDMLAVSGGETENFCYDALARLTASTVGGTTSCTGGIPASVAYDSLGDITSKSDVGTYTYGAGTAGPHAVTSIAGTVNGVVNPTFTYDDDGNMTGGAGAATPARRRWPASAC